MSGRTISEKQLNRREDSRFDETAVGFVLVALCFLPGLLLGGGRVVQAGDQLDGEIFTYLYGARYLFSGQERIMEYMGGVNREALFPPAPLLVLLYRILPARAAFFFSQFLAAETAFLGMDVLLKKLDCKRLTAFGAAVIFALLPFYGVYGLSVAGLPMLLSVFISLHEQEEEGKNRQWTSVLLIAGYGFLSSFVLIGFAVLGLLLLYGCRLLLSAKRKQYGWTYGGIFLLTAIYIWMSRGLVQQVLGTGTAQISHKSEYVLHGQPFWQTAAELFVRGAGHAPSFHSWMIVPAVVLLFGGACGYRFLEKKEKRQYLLLASCFAGAVGIALFYGMFHTEAVSRYRQQLGGFFVYFQVDRIYWFYPVLWYVMLALMAELCTALGRIVSGRFPRGRMAGTAAMLLLAVTAAGTVFLQSDCKKNLRQLYDPVSSRAVTWDKYYGTELFDQIREFIGEDQAAYRVASVGLNPAVPAYNGFYTVDGYSNNYELSYKKAFRKVIAGELEKDAALCRYFDDWGNRCYLFSSELGMEYYWEKDSGRTIRELSVDTEALRELGCTYVFAGVPVENAEALGWELTGIFESGADNCRYRICVYQIQ